jgi:hypothetical protein
VFRYGNPYRADEVSDHFGKYARIENPETQEHRALTLSRAYWPSSPECPAVFKKSNAMKAMDPSSGYVLVHAEEWFPDEPYGQYSVFIKAAPKEFLFQAEGKADVRGRIWGSFTNPPDVHEIVIVIAPQEFARMEPGIDYRVVPQNGAEKLAWKATDGLAIRKERPEAR